jgi:hypothetical protein
MEPGQQRGLVRAPPIFVTLADKWAECVGGYTAIQLLPAEDGELGRCMADPEPWAAFHQARAKLRIVSRLTNLSLLSHVTVSNLALASSVALQPE